MDRERVLKKLRQEEERTAIGWTGANGQRDPAGAIRELLKRERSKPHTSVQVKVKMEDPQERVVFVTLCRRYGLEPYREPRQRRTTFMLKAPESFLEDVFWPLFNACAQIVRGEINHWLLNLMAELNGENEQPRDALG